MNDQVLVEDRQSDRVAVDVVADVCDEGDDGVGEERRRDEKEVVREDGDRKGVGGDDVEVLEVHPDQRRMGVVDVLEVVN